MCAGSSTTTTPASRPRPGRTCTATGAHSTACSSTPCSSTSTSLSEFLELENDEHSGPYNENYETSGLPGLPGAGLSITPATPPPSPHPQPQAAPEEHEDRYTILIIVNIFAAFGGAPNERRVSPRERAKEEAKAKEVRVIGAKDLAEDRRMEAQQDACNIR